MWCDAVSFYLSTLCYKLHQRSCISPQCWDARTPRTVVTEARVPSWTRSFATWPTSTRERRSWFCVRVRRSTPDVAVRQVGDHVSMSEPFRPAHWSFDFAPPHQSTTLIPTTATTITNPTTLPLPHHAPSAANNPQHCHTTHTTTPTATPSHTTPLTSPPTAYFTPTPPHPLPHHLSCVFQRTRVWTTRVKTAGRASLEATPTGVTAGLRPLTAPWDRAVHSVRTRPAAVLWLGKCSTALKFKRVVHQLSDLWHRSPKSQQVSKWFLCHWSSNWGTPEKDRTSLQNHRIAIVSLSLCLPLRRCFLNFVGVETFKMSVVQVAWRRTLLWEVWLFSPGTSVRPGSFPAESDSNTHRFTSLCLVWNSKYLVCRHTALWTRVLP